MCPGFSRIFPSIARNPWTAELELTTTNTIIVYFMYMKKRRFCYNTHIYKKRLELLEAGCQSWLPRRSRRQGSEDEVALACHRQHWMEWGCTLRLQCCSDTSTRRRRSMVAALARTRTSTRTSSARRTTRYSSIAASSFASIAAPAALRELVRRYGADLGQEGVLRSMA